MNKASKKFENVKVTPETKDYLRHYKTIFGLHSIDEVIRQLLQKAKFAVLNEGEKTE